MSTPPPKTHEGEHHGDTSNAAVGITSATKTFALCAAVNSCNLGYDIGVSTNAGKLIQQDLDLSLTQREVLVGSINFWAMFGAFFAQYCSDTYGRRLTFIIAAVSFVAGNFLMVITSSYAFLLFGRMFIGLGVGTGLAIDPLYIAEVSPAKHRGELVTWSEFAINIGVVLGFSTGLFLSNIDDSIEWRIMLLLGCIMPVIMILLVIFVMPESPRWLVTKERSDDARMILKQIYPPGYDVEPVINDITEAMEREKRAEKAVGWSVLMNPSPALRRMLMVGVATAIAQQAVGIDAIQYFLLDVLEESGIESEQKQSLVLVVLGLVKLAFVYVGGQLFDGFGRRQLFFLSLVGMVVSLVLVAFGFMAQSEEDIGDRFVVAGLAFYLAFFSVGMGPGAWLIPSEVFAISIRAKAMGVATVSNRVIATLMSSTFLSTANAMGWAGFFFLLAIICLIVLAFLCIYLPETKGRSLEDMSVYFAEITGDNSILEAEAQLRGGNLEMTQPKSPDEDSPGDNDGIL